MEGRAVNRPSPRPCWRHMRHCPDPEISATTGTPEGQHSERWIAGRTWPPGVSDSSRGRKALAQGGPRPVPPLLRNVAATGTALPRIPIGMTAARMGRRIRSARALAAHWRATNRAGASRMPVADLRSAVLASYKPPAQHYLVRFASDLRMSLDWGRPTGSPDRQACRVPDCRCPSPCRAIAAGHDGGGLERLDRGHSPRGRNSRSPNARRCQPAGHARRC